MSSKAKGVAAAALFFVGALAAAAEPPAAARACAVCHGPVGVSNAPDAPHLAGQPAGYLEAQLKAFRGGARKHEVMSVIAKPLSDEDIRQVAAWYASIRVEATAPK